LLPVQEARAPKAGTAGLFAEERENTSPCYLRSNPKDRYRSSNYDSKIAGRAVKSG